MKDTDLLFWLRGGEEGAGQSLWPPAALLQVLPPHEWKHVHFKDGTQHWAQRRQGLLKSLWAADPFQWPPLGARAAFPKGGSTLGRARAHVSSLALGTEVGALIRRPSWGLSRPPQYPKSFGLSSLACTNGSRAWSPYQHLGKNATWQPPTGNSLGMWGRGTTGPFRT